MRIRVRFNRNVLGGTAGTIGWVEATPAVEKLVNNGSLRWLDGLPVPSLPDDPYNYSDTWVIDDESPGDESPS